MLETEANQRKKDTDFRCNKMEEEEVGHTFLLVKHMYIWLKHDFSIPKLP